MWKFLKDLYFCLQINHTFVVKYERSYKSKKIESLCYVRKKEGIPKYVEKQ